MPSLTSLPVLAMGVTDHVERWSPVVLFLIAGAIGYLRYQDRKRGPDPEDDEDW